MRICKYDTSYSHYLHGHLFSVCSKSGNKHTGEPLGPGRPGWPSLPGDPDLPGMPGCPGNPGSPLSPLSRMSK